MASNGHGVERRTALLDRQADLSSFIEEELEVLLDQAKRVNEAGG